MDAPTYVYAVIVEDRNVGGGTEIRDATTQVSPDTLALRLGGHIFPSRDCLATWRCAFKTERLLKALVMVRLNSVRVHPSYAVFRTPEPGNIPADRTHQTRDQHRSGSATRRPWATRAPDPVGGGGFLTGPAVPRMA